MATTIHGNLHVWSSKKQLSQVGENHSGVLIYHEKSSGNNGDDILAESKRQWAEARSIHWVLPNKRPEKLKDSLSEIEELLETSRIAAIKWKKIRHLQILFGNGTIVTVIVALNSTDIERISIDKSLVGKISHKIHNAVIEELYMVFTFSEKSKIGFVYYGKRPTDRKEGEKLNSLDPKFKLFDIPGPAGGDIDRKISVNCRGDLICVWWPSSSEAVWPWQSNGADLGRINLVVLSVSSDKLDVLDHTHTDLDPIGITFRYTDPNQLYSIESSQSSNRSYTLKCVTYECNENKIQRVSSVPIPVKAKLIAEGRNHKEDKLLLACEDGTLILYDDERQMTQTTKAKFTQPSMISWHPDDGIFLIANSKGDLQVFDQALASLPLQLSFESYGKLEHCCRLGQFFRESNKLDKVIWASDFRLGPPPDAIGCYDDLLLSFDRGPLCLLRIELGILSNGRLRPVEIVSEYIQHGQELEAVNFLNSMNWNTNGNFCFECLTIIMNHLFRLPFNLEREAYIEDALGSFYTPTRAISDPVMFLFRDHIIRLARRFFHHLLRHKRLEKAFMLAVDIGAKDLFVDIHHLANDLGYETMAENANQMAMHIHEEDRNHQDVMLEGQNYSSDEADFHRLDYRADDKNQVASFLYEPMADGELEHPDWHHHVDKRPRHFDRHHAEHKSTEPKSGGTLKRHDRKYGMTIPSSDEREKEQDKLKEPTDKMARKLTNSRTENSRNQGKRQENGEQEKQKDRTSKYEIINFGLV